MFADFVDALIGSLLSMSGMDIAKMLVMWAIGGVLIYLAIKKDMEPSLLLRHSGKPAALWRGRPGV